MQCVACGYEVIRDARLLRLLNTIQKKLPKAGGKLLQWYTDYKNNRMLRRYKKRYARVIKMATTPSNSEVTMGIRKIGELTDEFWSSLKPNLIVPTSLAPDIRCCELDFYNDGECHIHPRHRYEPTIAEILDTTDAEESYENFRKELPRPTLKKELPKSRRPRKK